MDSLQFKLIVGQKESSLKSFWSDGNRNIVLLHDSDSLVGKIYGLGGVTAQNFYFIVNYSQNRSLEYCKKIREKWFEMSARYALPPSFVYSNVLFLMNSRAELARFKHVWPEANVDFVSNNFTISEELFTLDSKGREYTAVLNAKPYDFKRPQLASEIGNLAIISYKEHQAKAEGRYVDVRSLQHAGMWWGIDRKLVSDINNRSYSGLALSASEGACYASTEYLLCGLPVISTPSEGGRDVYFNATNSRIVDATPQAVAAAATSIVLETQLGLIDHQAIRAEAVELQRRFRRTFAERVAQMTSLPDVALLTHLNLLINQSPVLQAYCNFWVDDAEVQLV